MNLNHVAFVVFSSAIVWLWLNEIVFCTTALLALYANADGGLIARFTREFVFISINGVRTHDGITPEAAVAHSKALANFGINIDAITRLSIAYYEPHETGVSRNFMHFDSAQHIIKTFSMAEFVSAQLQRIDTSLTVHDAAISINSNCKFDRILLLNTRNQAVANFRSSHMIFEGNSKASNLDQQASTTFNLQKTFFGCTTTVGISTNSRIKKIRIPYFVIDNTQHGIWRVKLDLVLSKSIKGPTPKRKNKGQEQHSIELKNNSKNASKCTFLEKSNKQSDMAETDSELIEDKFRKLVKINGSEASRDAQKSYSRS